MAFLNRESMRVVQRNDRGAVTYRKRYKFGDEVDVEHLDEGREDALLESGALVESEDDLRPRRSGNVPVPGSQVTGAATGEAADHSEHFDVPDDDDETDASTAVSPGETPEVTDEYTSMDYAELQGEAKGRGLNAGGSANDLRERLRADDNA